MQQPSFKNEATRQSDPVGITTTSTKLRPQARKPPLPDPFTRPARPSQAFNPVTVVQPSKFRLGSRLRIGTRLSHLHTYRSRSTTFRLSSIASSRPPDSGSVHRVTSARPAGLHTFRFGSHSKVLVHGIPVQPPFRSGSSQHSCTPDSQLARASETKNNNRRPISLACQRTTVPPTATTMATHSLGMLLDLTHAHEPKRTETIDSRI